VLTVLVAAGLAIATPTAIANAAGTQAGSVRGPVIQAAGCNHAQPGRFQCFALKNVTMTNLNRPGTTPAGYGPADLWSAYNIAKAVKSRGTGQTIGIVDGYDDPNAEADLAVYRSEYGLPACTTATGCFSKVNENGHTGQLPVGNQGWAEEITLDLDMVSAACPNCHILLVEGKTNGFRHLLHGEDYAKAHADAVSNSYGAVEVGVLTKKKFTAPYASTTSFIVASTGDDGFGEDDYAPQFPSVLPDVTAAGGTTLNASTGSGRKWTESAWGSTAHAWGAGSGCSTIFAKPSWQTDSGCSMRMDSDISSDADPETGVAIYDSYGGDTGWEVFGGTSAASPFLAGVVGLAENGSTIGHDYPYTHTKDLYDPTGGNNDVLDGQCLAGDTPAYYCNGEKGYDGPTGLGSPDGYGAL
jgi:subtilase family serine protease